jgi:hypothetical protein
MPDLDEPDPDLVSQLVLGDPGQAGELARELDPWGRAVDDIRANRIRSIKDRKFRLITADALREYVRTSERDYNATMRKRSECTPASPADGQNAATDGLSTIRWADICPGWWS